MEVEGFLFVVDGHQEVALLPSLTFLGIVLGGLQPRQPGRRKIGAKHGRHNFPPRHGEHRRARGLGGDVPAKFGSQFGLDVLPGVLAVLG